MKSEGRQGHARDFPTFRDNLIEARRKGIDLDLDLNAKASGVECYWFRLHSPDCKEIFRDGTGYDNRCNRSFLARCYRRANHPQSHVVLMYNGLDETIYTNGDQLFAFYDELGLRLASQGKLAILLPTPYHMNRALSYKSAEDGRKLCEKHGERFIRMHVPNEALTWEPSMIYTNHLQGSKETLELCRFFLEGRVEEAFPELKPRAIVPERIAATVRSWVTERPSISLLGYSLGGLRALTEFLFDRRRARDAHRPPLFSGCVPVCSGGSLADLSAPRWIDETKWKAMLDNLVLGDSGRYIEAARDNFPHEQEFASAYFQTLKDIFLGNAQTMRSLGSQAVGAARSMFFVLGGADTLVPPNAIQRINPEGGVNILQVSGMGHLFSFDLAWNRTKGLICDVLTQFIDNAPTLETVPDPGELIQHLVLLDLTFQLMPYRARIEPKGLRRAARSLPRADATFDYVARVFGAEFSAKLQATSKLEPEPLAKMVREFLFEILYDVALQVKRRLVNPALYWPEWERHFLDGLLARDGELRRAVQALGPAGDSMHQLDERLVKTEFLTERRRRMLVALQEQKLTPIRQRMAERFEKYLAAQTQERPDAIDATPPDGVSQR